MMKTAKIILFVATSILLTTMCLGESVVSITGNFIEGNQVIIPIIYEGNAVSSLQLECSYLPEEMKLEEILPGEVLGSSDKEMIERVAEEVSHNLIRLLFVGLNQTEISEGPVAYLIFTRRSVNQAGRILLRSVESADKFGQPVRTRWHDRQSYDQSQTQDNGYLMSFSQAIDEGCRVYYQGYYDEPVDLYLKRIYEVDGVKHWDYFPIEKNVRGDLSGNFDIDAGDYKGRVVMQVFGTGAEVDWESELLESQDIASKNEAVSEKLAKRENSSFEMVAKLLD